ncbi:exo-beta-N-acetylmuramidase NamZ domain-containing protein [Paraburkholderia caribensis]|uniref:exo-beta-N-acetylmuramidase NamZ domain-containing protein n=1 Tax=Paraburkholderia caribensis TaxID=75105 RepID=UPI0034D2B5A3
MESPQSLRSRAIAALRPLGAFAFIAWSAASHARTDTLLFDGTARAVLSQIVWSEIANGRVPGAVIVAGTADGVSARLVLGNRMLRPHVEPMTADTVFDLASLTKVIATTTAIMQLVERGKLDLTAPVARYWPAFGAQGKAQITVQQLLTHTSGLPAEPPGLGVAAQHRMKPAVLLRNIAGIEPVAMPDERTLYSDVNFVVLGVLVARVSGMPFDAYCRRFIFAPLGMQDTGFTPDPAISARAAPTTADSHGMRQGHVHDPLASALEGVAGNAGLFSTAADLARFARMLLNGGLADSEGATPAAVRRARILRPESIDKMAVPLSADATPPWRGLGWELDAPLATNRYRLPPIGAIGHTGFTGTGIWIDFVTRRFLIVLTNRVHEANGGDVAALRVQTLALLSSGIGPVTPRQIAHAVPDARDALGRAVRPPAANGPVRTGIDVLAAQQFSTLAGMRIGLVTNRTGFDAHGERTVDVLLHAPGVTLVRLFSPEHGLDIDADEPVRDSVDPSSGLVVHSLYGETKRFAPGALDGLDALVFDLQDAGVRFFTYETTLGYALEAAAAAHIPLIVLDRPNPLGADRFGGPSLDAGRDSFTGYFPLPLQHGMTSGELARLFNEARHIGADLRVVPMEGYLRSMRFADTGLGWLPISPNLRTLSALDLYPDVALLEGANVSVGRGTPHPFEWVGAPWIDGARLAAALNGSRDDARFEPVDFVPTESTYRGQLCHGVRITRTQSARAPGSLGVALVATLHTLYPQAFDIAATRDAIGSAAIWQAIERGDGPDALQTLMAREADAFQPVRQRYLRY